MSACTSNWVFGVEGDIAAAGINGTTTTVFRSLINPLSSKDGFTATMNVEALATIRGRVGYSWGPGMFYVTGGGAWERLQTATSLSSNAAPGQFAAVSTTNTNFDRFGGVVGLGAEWMIAPHWTLRSEYLYYMFNGSNTVQSITTPCGGGTNNICAANHNVSSNNLSQVRVGVNYLFNAR